jgi:hypothetical protein
MSFSLSPGQLMLQPENRFLCCLLQSDYLSPARFVADTKTTRTARLAQNGVPLFWQNEEVGRVQRLQVGGSELRLYAYGALNEGVDVQDWELGLALPVFQAIGVECPICHRVFEAQSDEACPCIHQASCLILRTICIESVRLCPRWNEDSKEPGTLSEYLARQFKTAVDYIQVIDPL